MNKKSLKPVIVSLVFLLIMWLSFLLGMTNKDLFVRLGIFPRKVESLFAIFTAPFVHGDWEHLFFNTTSFAVLTTMLFYFYYSIADKVFALSFILTGVLVWVFARPSYHIGMSGIIYAEFGFLFFAGFLTRDRMQIVASFITVMFYGSMVWGVFPGKSGVSWESHLLGFVIGVFCIFLFRKDLFTAKYKFEMEKEVDEFLQFDVLEKRKRIQDSSNL